MENFMNRATWFIIGSTYFVVSAFLGWLFFQFHIPETPSGFVSRELFAKILIPIMVIGFVHFGTFILSQAFKKDCK